MAKTVADAVLDGAFNILNDCVLMTVCTTQPTTYAEATNTSDAAGYKLADISMAASDFVIADAAGGGRQCTMGAQAGVTIDITGTALFVALCTADTLYYVTTCTSQVLTAAGTVDFPAWKVTIGDPT
jgi:hypothetical protein